MLGIKLINFTLAIFFLLKLMTLQQLKLKFPFQTVTKFILTGFFVVCFLYSKIHVYVRAEIPLLTKQGERNGYFR